MNIHLATFTSSDMLQSLERIEREAKQSSAFKTIHCLTEKSLDDDFVSHFRDRLRFGTHGFGYWCWKPQIVLQVMMEVPRGDVVFYCDAGCTITPLSSPKIHEYAQAALDSESGICAFSLDPVGFHPRHEEDDFYERKWTKEDLFRHFGMPPDDPARSKSQFAATVFAMHVNANTENFVRKWRDVFIEDFSLVDDTPSKYENAPDFIEHRYDQSVFSLLLAGEKPSIRSYFELILECNAPGAEGVFATRKRQFTFLTRIKRQLTKQKRKALRLLGK